MLMKRIDPTPVAAPSTRAWPMVVRAGTALLGGYAVAAAAATLLARLLPVARVEAVLWGMIASFAIFAGVALWCFREARLGRVVAIVWGIAAVGAGSGWLLGVRP